MTQDMHGAGGGGASRTPTRTPDTLLSQDYIELVLGLSEGPIKGLKEGTHSALENFYVGTTPLVNKATGEANFPDFAVNLFTGRETDEAVKFKLGGQASNIPVNVRLSQTIPVVRQTPPNLRGQINRLEFRIYFNQLVLVNDDGSFEETARFKISYKKSASPTWIDFEPETAIKGKTSSGAVKDFVIDVPLITDDDYDLRVIKNSPDNAGTEGSIIELTWESVQAITMQPRKFDDLALMHIYGRASNQFSSVPDFAGVYEGLLVRVPSNYNAEAKTYDESTPWNGTFKLAFTDNPAWILYELCMNQRWGLPRYYLSVATNRYEFYSAGKWCDEPVQLPSGDYQPRFTFNEVFQDAKNGMEALRYVAGAFNSIILDDGVGTITLRTDQPRIPKQIFTPENVANGDFSYTFTDITTRFNDVTAVFINPDLDWAEDRRLATIDNTEAIAANGRIPTEFVAVGCTNVHEAVRRANYHYITANHECSTVSFVTSRFGMFTEPFETIYVADPDAGWSSPGRIKNITGGKIYFRDPVFFPDTARRNLVLQTYDGLQTIPIVPATSGVVYVVDIQDGVVPQAHADRTVYSIQDNNFLGLAKPFKVLSIEEVDGSPDAYKITALEVYVNKYPDADSGAESEAPDYGFQMPGEPLLPSTLNLASGTSHIQINTDGTIIYRVFASWERPLRSFTDYYEIDYREAGAEAWETVSKVYGDSVYIAPLKDNTRYHFRLFAVTPFGKRSTRSVDHLDYLVGGKDGPVVPVAGLAVQLAPGGWEASWGTPTFPDYGVTELRLGLSVQTWDNLPTLFKGKANKHLFSYLTAGTYLLRAKHLDTSDNYSTAASALEMIIAPPAMPMVSGHVNFDEPYLFWQNCMTSQPIKSYHVYLGPTFEGATSLGGTVDTKFFLTSQEPGIRRYWVQAEDHAGNLGAPSYTELLIKRGVIDEIDDIDDSWMDEIDDIIDRINDIDDRLDAGFGGVSDRVDDVSDRIAASLIDSMIHADRALAESTTRIRTDLGESIAAVAQFKSEYVTDKEASAQQIDVIAAELNGNKAAVVAVSTALVTLDESVAQDRIAVVARFEDNEASVVQERTARTTATTALASDISGVTARVGATEAEIVTERQARVDDKAATATQITGISARMGTAESRIAAEETARATADSAMTSTITGAVSRIGAAEARIIAEETTRATADSAMSSSISVIGSRVGTAEARIISEETTRATADSAMASSLSALTSTVNDNNANAISRANTNATNISAVASQLTSLDAMVGYNYSIAATKTEVASAIDSAKASTLSTLRAETANAVAGLQTAAQVATTVNSAIASNNTVLRSEIGGVSASVGVVQTALATLSGNVSAGIMFQTQIMDNGKRFMAGFSIGVSKDSAGVYQSEVIFNAYNFKLINQVQGDGAIVEPFKVEGGVTYINEARIKTADIGTLKLAGEAVTIPVAANSSNTHPGVDLYIPVPAKVFVHCVVRYPEQGTPWGEVLTNFRCTQTGQDFGSIIVTQVSRYVDSTEGGSYVYSANAVGLGILEFNTSGWCSIRCFGSGVEGGYISGLKGTMVAQCAKR